MDLAQKEEVNLKGCLPEILLQHVFNGTKWCIFNANHDFFQNMTKGFIYSSIFEAMLCVYICGCANYSY